MNVSSIATFSIFPRASIIWSLQYTAAAVNISFGLFSCQPNKSQHKKSNLDLNHINFSSPYFLPRPNNWPSGKTLPKALRTQAFTALTSNFGLVVLVQYAW